MTAAENPRDLDRRPDPEALLAEVLRKESPRGRLKIFLGYAPGVGKTYEMLQDARLAKRRGVDVVIGIVETHGRPETQALLEDLEIIPRRETPYRNITLREMDLDAIERRRPRLVLVDELAHTNAPGSRHEKRYQDIQSLLDRNIDVYTTVNIQHLESLNDRVAEITGIRMQETVPDFILDKADEIGVVDIPIEQLHERLQEGKVYVPELAGDALENFFKRGNLLALRELALRRVAGKLDQELINYMKARGIAGPWATSERLLVCVGASPYARRLLRKAFQMASDLKAEWYAVYVETPTHMTLSQKERADLTDTLALARDLGAKVVSLSGTDVGQEIVRFASREKISKVVLGRPRGSFLRQMLYRSPVYEILKESVDFDTYFIAPSKEDLPWAIPVAPHGVRRRFFAWRDYLLATLTIVPITAIAALLFYVFHIKSVVVLFVLAPMASALFFGIGPSLFVSVVSALVYDYFYTAPYFSFRISNPDIGLEVVIFVVTSILTAQLAKLVRRQQQALSMRLGQMEILSDMGKELLGIPNIGEIVMEAAGPIDDHVRSTLKFMKVTVQDAIAGTTLRYLDRALHLPCVVILWEGGEKARVWAKSDPGLSLTDKDQAILQWVLTHDQPAGKGTKTLEASDYCFIPISSKGTSNGAIGLQSDFGLLLPQERTLISAIANLAAVSLENLEAQTSESTPRPT
jgi:two-component system sensor histidine kinase KdpD